MLYLVSLILSIGLLNLPLQAASVISDQAIQTQKNLTRVMQLKNGVPVILRKSEGSDILQINVNFRYGFKDQQRAAKVLSDLMFTTMTRGAKDWPKERLFQTLEKYSAGIGCDMGVEASSCKMTSIDDFWTEVLPLFAASILQPSFAREDIDLQGRNQQIRLQARTDSPEFTANEITNRIFYSDDHPYFLPINEQIAYLEKIDPEQVRILHRQLLKDHVDSIVVVSSLPAIEILKKLEEAFGGLKIGNYQAAPVPQPGSSSKQDFIFEDRKIPTAYIRIKMPMPGVTDQDFETANLMIKILDDELGLEIRTRQSLSYAVFSYMINYSRGIGMIGVSTSKPKETLEAISKVIHSIKQRRYTDDELFRHKTVYSTSYFLRMEDHASLASSLSRYWLYYNSTDPMYEAPSQLAKLKAKEIQDVAKKYLSDFKMGVVYGRNDFQDEWASNFLKQHRK